MIRNLIEKLNRNNYLHREEICAILDNYTAEDLDLVCKFARDTKQEFYGDKVFIRGIIEFTNYCKNTCDYCGLQAQNRKVSRYRMTKGEILACAKIGYDLGIRTFVLQGGEDRFFDDDKLADIVESIKNEFNDVAITLSIGERDKLSYSRLYMAGADRYLLRQETVDCDLYQSHHANMSLQNRIDCIKNLKEIGFQVGSGFIVGLKGQTNEILAEDLEFIAELQPHMVGIGPFIPHCDTVLKNEKYGDTEKTLICMAISRLLVPHTLMPVTTAFSVLQPDGGYKMGLDAGANVIMPNLTLSEYRDNYQIYNYKNSVKDNVQKRYLKDLDYITREIEKADCTVDMGKGDNVLWSRKSG